MLHSLNQINSLWFSLGPLLFVNVFGLLTVVIFAFVYKKNASLYKVEEFEKRHDSKFLGRWFKEYWYWVTTPIEKISLLLGLTPDFFTTFGFFLSCLAGYAFYEGSIGIAGWLVILSGTCDMFDGRIARLTGKVSRAGAFYDSVMDRFGELATFIGLAGFYRNSWLFWFVLAGIVGSMMVSYTRARGEAMGVDCKVGTMQRPERIVYLGVGSIFSPILGYFIGSRFEINPEYLLIIAILLIAIMTNFTAIYRMIWIMNKLRKTSVTSTSENNSEKTGKRSLFFRHI